ncbi:glycosyltransferase family 2 protein [Halalkalibacterium halodurans]|uniref:Glycosyl transferase n=1 Tax=Halalkalibacterium halodurans TaxID=86665 RepID=A0A0M0KGG0_ALKHA|nr:glycosyltransferase [Halalkalibacterium halodurans]TPE68331.1 glycosyltransferase [Halalkalibacterium halodurans]
MNPKVSIIVPFFNCSFIDQALNSALNQTYTNIEIIVVDDGSTLHVERLEPFLKNIRYIEKENGGTATALNLGIQNASGEYIAWLSSDDYFLSEKISKQLTFMLENHADASFTNYDYVDKDNHVLLPFIGKRFSDINELYKAMLEMNPINGCTVMMKKSIFNNIGYFNPNLRYTQDYDMWFRLLLHGYKVLYLDEVLTKYRAHENSGTNKNQPELKREIKIVRNYYLPKFKRKFNID